jgi:hypothetical protein
MPEARESGVRVERGSGKPLFQMVSLLIRFARVDGETAHPHRGRGEYGRRCSARWHAGGRAHGIAHGRRWVAVPYAAATTQRRPAGHGVTQAGSGSHPHLIAYFPAFLS